MADIQKIFNSAEFVSEGHKSFAYSIYLGALSDKHLAKKLEGFNLAVNKYRILRGLAKVHPEGTGVYKLKEFLVVGDADISRLVNRLVARELVTREPGKENRSSMQVTITEKGLQLIREVQANLPEFIEPMMCFTEDEARQLNQLLAKAIDSFVAIDQKATQN